MDITSPKNKVNAFPIVSVVITAHNRKEYLLNAVESVIGQITEGFKIEVIVVKNFIDQEIDSYLSRNGVINVLSKYDNLGGKLSEGIQNSKGDIISFLEDDDFFYPGKLDAVTRAFASNSELIYFHNSAEQILEYGKKTGRVMMSAGSDLSLNGPLSFGNLMRLLKKGAHGNNSCISIRKDLAFSLLPSLLKLNVTCDGFILLWASGQNKKIEFSCNILTGYMVHQSFTHRRIAGVDDFVNSNALKASVMHRDKRTGVEILRTENVGNMVIRAADYIELKERLNLNLFSDSNEITFRDLVSYLYLSILGRRYSGIGGFVVHAFSLFSKGVARKLSFFFSDATTV